VIAGQQHRPHAYACVHLNVAKALEASPHRVEAMGNQRANPVQAGVLRVVCLIRIHGRAP
jgi:hypothetical protein